jgi:hypothetical protein
MRKVSLGFLLLVGCGMQTSLESPGPDPSLAVGGIGGPAGTQGSAGSAGAGGATGGGGTGGSASSSKGVCTMDAVEPGYLQCGPWKGYAWTIATEPDMGSTISPSDFSSASKLPLCASGRLGRVDSAVGLLGFNVNQASGQDSLEDTWTVTGTGIGYELDNPGASPVRIQIQGAAGYPDETWCAEISGSRSGSVAWSTFSQSCWWPSTGPFFDGQVPLQKVMLLVPGANGVELSFDICLIGLYPY